ncbi:conserved hypothetical protein [Histoplasma mississippiense (nom. inval.)]|uniref:conserved hypothetical protein n=1 Tax=Ajellomyces capsulatus (strain NAm1 / WU24) TaxID=2059318 RepID=UPI000157BE0B|nr:conserved hypothetical protein [Histoplasma mississippiense (nom. inval.)]EDN05985.1 conserved hypothetical protein [Histoplasma mississippiense (nom. inval.)]
MREVNFSIPNVNKAAVNITTTLYDRRALDCTSTLPLINSLNHLAYLTTSSARIRDILTVDGGIEQLVCILKEGRSKDLMEMWKWNLAFQCVVNIGVRGTENVRTRVVEADIVPVVATILDNYIRVVDKIRARADAEARRNTSRVSKTSSRSRDQTNRSSFFERAPTTSDHRTTRRQAPPPSIEIPHPYSRDAQHGESGEVEITPSPQVILTSPPERTTFSRDARSHRTHEGRHQPVTHRHRVMQPLATAIPPVDVTAGFGLRPVRDADRLPSVVPGLQPGLNSQPESPTTPHTVGEHQNSVSLNARPRRRPSIRQRPSASGESDDANGDDVVMGEDPSPHHVAEPIVDVQNGMEIDNVGESGSMLDGSSETHPGNGVPGLSPVRQTALNTASPVPQQTPYPFYLRDRQVPPGVLTAMPRDEDVLMALQLLAYVSKYCNLRSYFQKTHLVPKLKLGKDIRLLDDPNAPSQPSLEPEEEEEEEEEEYLLPDDFNIFPLVERFTIRHHTKDMQYWACVVMRNLCRKDDARGGIPFVFIILESHERISLILQYGTDEGWQRRKATRFAGHPSS